MPKDKGTNMKWKENASILTDNFLYDLIDGGYIKPSELLEDQNDIKKVEDAIKTVQEFKQNANDQDIVEYM